MSEESINFEINKNERRITQLKTRIGEIHSEIAELSNEIVILRDNLSLIRKKEGDKEKKCICKNCIHGKDMVSHVICDMFEECFPTTATCCKCTLKEATEDD
ncbi:MAG: hypothetical protein EU531_10910 [Promethearchaeota archaeon]|nr:MAG: hypothetical protein EU531_10910 [Candidatus Lokiarchaeota archaeon]